MTVTDITNLNFTLSAVCGARCVYCPRPRSSRPDMIFMPQGIVEKVLHDSTGFPIDTIDTGESGDSFLNPDVLDILQLIRSRSDATIRMFTNFRNFSPDMIDVVLENGLLDKVITNVDGSTAERYKSVKGMDLDAVESNIRYFVTRARELRSPVHFRVQSLTLSHYIHTVRRILGRDPLHVDPELLDSADDFDRIVDRCESWGVTPERSIVTLWAEKDSDGNSPCGYGHKLKKLLRAVRPKPCGMLEKIQQSFFVMPTGQVYLCCADFDFETIIGDVTKNSVREIVEGDLRRQYISALSRGDFRKIGGPCLRSHLCRIY